MKAVCRRFWQDVVGMYYQSRGVDPFPVWGDVQNFPQTTNLLPSNHDPAAYYPQIVLKNDELCLDNAREPRESPQTVEEEPERAEPHSAAGEAQEGVRRPWYRRIFGGNG
jgi:hypothetical protein